MSVPGGPAREEGGGVVFSGGSRRSGGESFPSLCGSSAGSSSPDPDPAASQRGSGDRSTGGGSWRGLAESKRRSRPEWAAFGGAARLRPSVLLLRGLSAGSCPLRLSSLPGILSRAKKNNKAGYGKSSAKPGFPGAQPGFLRGQHFASHGAPLPFSSRGLWLAGCSHQGVQTPILFQADALQTAGYTTSIIPSLAHKLEDGDTIRDLEYNRAFSHTTFHQPGTPVALFTHRHTHRHTGVSSWLAVSIREYKYPSFSKQTLSKQLDLKLPSFPAHKLGLGTQ